MRPRDDGLDVHHVAAILNLLRFGRQQHIDAVRTPADVLIDPLQLQLELIGRERGNPEHSDPACFGDFDYHVSAMRKPEDRDLDAEHLANPGTHGCLPIRWPSGRISGRGLLPQYHTSADATKTSALRHWPCPAQFVYPQIGRFSHGKRPSELRTQRFVLYDRCSNDEEGSDPAPREARARKGAQAELLRQKGAGRISRSQRASRRQADAYERFLDPRRSLSPPEQVFALIRTRLTPTGRAPRRSAHNLVSGSRMSRRRARGAG